MRNISKTDLELFVLESTGLKMTGFTRVNLSVNKIVRSLLPGQILYYGDLMLNMSMVQGYNPGSVNLVDMPGYDSLFTSLGVNKNSGAPLGYIRDAIYIGNAGAMNPDPAFPTESKIEALLFDNLLWLISGEIAPGNNVGDLNAPASYPVPFDSYQWGQLIPGAQQPQTQFWATAIAANPAFVYTPQMFRFDGYQIRCNGTVNQEL